MRRGIAARSQGRGLHWTFAPMIDIARDPRWGRIVEGAGEDPYLGSRMAAAQVRGFQGGDRAAGTSWPAPSTLAPMAPPQAGATMTAPTFRATLQEVYLPPFEPRRTPAPARS